MSQNPNGGPPYDPYGPGLSNPNYPPVPGTGYGAGQPPSGPNPYGPYGQPPSGPGDLTPNSNYGSPYAPPPPNTDPSSGPYGAFDPTVISQHGGSGYPGYPPVTGYPSYPTPGTPSNPGYPPATGGQSYPSYSTPGMPSNPGYPPPGGNLNTPSPQKPRKNNARTVLIALVALLVVVAAVLGGVFYNNHETNIRRANGTATAISSTAQAYSQATAHAQATTTYVQSHYPFSTNLVLNDPLSNDSNVSKYGWDTGDNCVFTNNTYQVTEKKSGYFAYCTASKPTFANFTYEVQMSIQKGGDNADGGLVFRADMNSSHFYVLYVGTDGSYELDIQTSSDATNTRTLKTGTVSGFASGFAQVHTLGVVANGSQISLYVDQKQITQLNDTTYTSGQVGVISAYGSSATVVVYNNAKVWQL